MALAAACSSNSVVGKWKVSQRYDVFYENWKPVDQELYLEFFTDGRYKSSVEGALTSGTYMVDQTQSPYRILFNDDKSGSFNAIIKIDGNTLTLKSSKDTKSQCTTNFQNGKDDVNCEMVTLERK